ncbi:MAG: antibiotic biosynthesis monooxygenase family protein [Dehalococcoidia bacterium]|nr:antibiotic biosynthesis monooxygenase family protein [Dehalococcoidia bacterium]
MVRVVIERHFQKGKEAELEDLLVELRSRAMAQPGYVSGETLRSLQDPSLWVVLSTWLDVSQWKAWEASPERREIEDRIARIAKAPAKVSVFSFVWRACWSENEAERWHKAPSSGPEASTRRRRRPPTARSG